MLKFLTYQLFQDGVDFCGRSLNDDVLEGVVLGPVVGLLVPRRLQQKVEFDRTSAKRTPVKTKKIVT